MKEQTGERREDGEKSTENGIGEKGDHDGYTEDESVDPGGTDVDGYKISDGTTLEDDRPDDAEDCSKDSEKPEGSDEFPIETVEILC